LSTRFVGYETAERGALDCQGRKGKLDRGKGQEEEICLGPGKKKKKTGKKETSPHEGSRQKRLKENLSRKRRRPVRREKDVLRRGREAGKEGGKNGAFP